MTTANGQAVDGLVSYDDFVEHLGELPLRPDQTADARRVLAGTERALSRYLQRPFVIPTNILNSDGSLTESVQTTWTGYCDLKFFVAPNTLMSLGSWGTTALTFNPSAQTYGAIVDPSFFALDAIDGTILDGAAYGSFYPRVVADGVFTNMPNSLIQVTYFPAVLPDDDLDDVKLAIMDVAIRSVTELHSDARGRGVPGIGEPLRNHFLEKPLNWAPEELVWFDRLRKRTLV